ncbi:MAG: polysaccharide deacetylase [Oscillospiraceae bacterium]|jgi:peptidoglycan/xylan/chitin deacetylase (PgdA/CDA1 family)|nr:polysaccharide deacetylase [Oscillospiraceae bacterium]
MLVKQKYIRIFGFGVVFFALACAAVCVSRQNARSVPASRTEEKKHIIYLTFDDGPSKNTSFVLEILKREKIPATFFVIAPQNEEGEKLYRRIIDEGHCLALHSYTHNTDEIYKSVQAYEEDFFRLQKTVYELTGQSPDIFRFPGGSTTSACKPELMKTLINHMAKKGYTYFDWSIDLNDSGPYALPADEIYKNLVKEVEKQPGCDLIILMHDDSLRSTLPAALEKIIIYLRGKGYVFDALCKDTALE